MRKIFVTGGAGFIGANFVQYILNRFPEDRILVFDKLTYSGNLVNLAPFKEIERLSFVRGDIAVVKDLEAVLDETITHVVHFAAESHVDRSIIGPEEFMQANVMGTFRILERLRELGWAVGNSGRAERGKRGTYSNAVDRRMVHVSTDEVYGTLGPTGYFTEETAYKPNSPYSATKAASDHLVRSYFHTYDLPVVTTNCSNNYGPYQFPEKLIPLMILNCLHGRELPVYGKGENVRDWLYVEDHNAAIERVMENGVLGESYVIGGRSEKTNMEIVRLICTLMDEFHPEGAPHDALISLVADRPGHDFRYAIDCSRIERELGWRPNVSFADGMRRTLRWYLENRDWWEGILSGEYKNYYREKYGK